MTTLADTHWFAIQAHPCGESAAEFSLRSLSIETLLPLVRRRVRHATRAARLAVRALFPGYLFARFCAEDSLRAVSYSRGVVRVLGAGGCPISVEDSIITSIRARIGVEGCVEFDEHPLKIGDHVRLTAGPLAGWCGVFERTMSDTQRVQILLQTVQECRLVISRDWLERAEAA